MELDTIIKPYVCYIYMPHIYVYMYVYVYIYVLNRTQPLSETHITIMNIKYNTLNIDSILRSILWAKLLKLSQRNSW